MIPAADVQRPLRRGASLMPAPLEPAAFDRARLAVVPPDTHAADQLAHTMRLVKAARFNAATRLERKQAVS
ncbi:MAG: hypothetical protein AB7S70_05265, partial [Hyphomicrobium sp.]